MYQRGLIGWDETGCQILSLKESQISKYTLTMNDTCQCHYRYTINSKTDLDFHPTFTIAPDESGKKFIAISYPGEFVFFLFLQAIDRVIPANIQSPQEASLLYSFDSGQGNDHLRSSRYQRSEKKCVMG